ncbi:MAG: EamA family transporter [Myxococcota bacterium]
MASTDLAIVLVSALLHAGWSVAIKGSGDPLAFNVLQWLAFSLVLVGLAPWIDLHALPKEVWWLLAGASVAHGIYFYWLSRAFEEGDLSLVYPIVRSTPALLPLFAIPLLGELPSEGGLMGVAGVVAGIWLVQGSGRLHARDFAATGLRFAYLTLAATVAYSLIDKQAMTLMADRAPVGPLPWAFVYMLLLSGLSGGVLLPLALRTRGLRDLLRAGSGLFGRAALAAGVSGLSYGLCLMAFETSDASYVVAVRQTSVLFAAILAVPLLGERIGLRRALGALSTVIGVAIIALWG